MSNFVLFGAATNIEDEQSLNNLEDLSESNSEDSNIHTNFLTDKNKSENEVTSKDQNKKEKKSKKFVIHSIIIVLGLLAFFIFIGWVVPHDSWWQYQREQYSEGILDYLGQNNAPQDVIDWVTNNIINTDVINQIIANSDPYSIIAPEKGFYGVYDIFILIAIGFLQAFPIILYLFVLGAFIEIIIKTKTFDALIGSLVNKVKNKKIFIVPVVFVFFSLFGTIWGMQEESLAYYSIMVPLMVISGFEPVVAVLIMMVGNTTGMAASVINPFAVGVASSTVGVSTGDLFFFRLVFWFLITALGATFVTFYAYRHQETEKEAEEEIENPDLKAIEENLATDLQDFKKMTKRQLMSIISFGVVIFIMILGVIPWIDLLGLDQASYVDAWNDFFSTYFFFLSTIITPFGLWGFYEISALFIFGIFLQIIIHRLKIKEWTRYVYDGMKGMIGLVTVIAIARSISIVIIYSGLIYTFINSLVIPLNNLYLYFLIMFFVFLLFSMIIPSTSSLAVLAFPLIAGLFAIKYTGDNAEIILAGTVLMYLIAEGIANMVTPTQAVVLASMDASGVEYKKYLKVVSPYALMLVVLTIAVIIPILVLII